MPSRRVSTVLASTILVGVGAVACTADDRGATPTPSRTGGSTDSLVREVSADGLSGVVYLLAGDDELTADLYSLELPSAQQRRLTSSEEQHGVSSFAAGPAGLAVASAATGSDVLTTTSAAGVRTDEERPGSIPAIDDRGRVLTVRGTADGIAVDLSEPTGEHRELISVPDDYGVQAVWGPKGTALVLTGTEPEERPTRVREFAEDGTQLSERTLDGNFALVPNPYPARQPFIATQVETRSSVLLGGSLEREQNVPDGWEGMCVSPDGRSVLVTDAARLGIWSPGGSVVPLGTASQDVLGCQWLEKPAPGADDLS